MQTPCALTTKDNPFNPFEDFDEWFLYDLEKGYQCCERVAKFSHVTNKMTQNEVNIEVERAINEILKYDFTKNYTKVYLNQQKNDEIETFV